MIYFLDTNILIYLIKNRPPEVAERLNALPVDDEVGMSFVTYAELLQGAERSTQHVAVRERLTRLVQEVPVRYPEGPAICQAYAEEYTRLKAAGTPIGANDLWIACHALAEGAVVVTNNTREFCRIPGLKVENWAA